MAFSDWVSIEQSIPSLITYSIKIIKLRLGHFLLILLSIELVGNLLSSHLSDKLSNLDYNPYLTITASFTTSFIFTNLAGVMLTIMVGRYATSRSISFVEMLVKALRFLPLILLSNLVFGILVVLGLAFLIFPGIGIAVYLIFFMGAIVISSKKTYKAFEYSYRLVQGRWWNVFFKLIFVYFIGFILVFFAEYLSIKFHLSLISDIVKTLINGFLYVYLTVYFLNIESLFRIKIGELNA